MELTNESKPATVEYLGNEIFELPSEKTLMIKRTGGADILSAKVPAGKKWEVHAHVEIIETDA
jgi:hypothetical protein